MNETQTGFARAARRALATFVFAVTGQLVGVQVFDADMATWIVVGNAGIGALLNLAYRWSESELKKPEPVDQRPTP
jgi:hypothetical protein